MDEGSDNEMRGFVVECNRRRSIWYRATVHITAIRKGIVADQIERAPFTSPGLLIVCERQSMRAERPERHHDDPVGFRNLSQYVMTSILTKAVMALREVTR